jgi:hypothetical protein
MSQGRKSSEVALLVGLFMVLPAVFIFLVLMPTLNRMKEHRGRLETAQEAIRALPDVQPLSAEERKLLEDPKAEWKARIPVVSNDGERLTHYNRVVTDLQRTWKNCGVTTLSMRSTWDPIKGSFTVPESFGSVPQDFPPAYFSGQGTPSAWVIEARLAGKNAPLFTAMEALSKLNPLLEPVGIRWESSPEGPKEMLILRNIILSPTPSTTEPPNP